MKKHKKNTPAQNIQIHPNRKWKNEGVEKQKKHPSKKIKNALWKKHRLAISRSPENDLWARAYLFCHCDPPTHNFQTFWFLRKKQICTLGKLQKKVGWKNAKIQAVRKLKKHTLKNSQKHKREKTEKSHTEKKQKNMHAITNNKTCTTRKQKKHMATKRRKCALSSPRNDFQNDKVREKRIATFTNTDAVMKDNKKARGNENRLKEPRHLRCQHSRRGEV